MWTLYAPGHVQYSLIHMALQCLPMWNSPDRTWFKPVGFQPDFWLIFYCEILDNFNSNPMSNLVQVVTSNLLLFFEDTWRVKSESTGSFFTAETNIYTFLLVHALIRCYIYTAFPSVGFPGFDYCPSFYYWEQCPDIINIVAHAVR